MLAAKDTGCDRLWILEAMRMMLSPGNQHGKWEDPPKALSTHLGSKLASTEANKTDGLL